MWNYINPGYVKYGKYNLNKINVTNEKFVNKNLIIKCFKWSIQVLKHLTFKHISLKNLPREKPCPGIPCPEKSCLVLKILPFREYFCYHSPSYLLKALNTNDINKTEKILNNINNLLTDLTNGNTNTKLSA